MYAEDRPAWQAIRLGRVVTEQEAWDNSTAFEESRYYRDLMDRGNFRHIAAAPLASPIFPGYPGAIEVYRTSEQGPFSPADMQQMARLARQYDQAVEAARQSRQGKTAVFSWMRRPAARQFIFDGQLKPVLHDNGLATIDERVREQMLRHAKQALARVEEAVIYWSDRVMFPDTRGDLWIFRAVTFAKFPALGAGPFVFYCMQPDCKDWGAVRAADLQADVEIARLVPAMQFMYREFGRGPTLNEIAQTVDISPFHFHRRFTELFGITPKHFLLECQIHAAKTHMAVGDKDLVQIANSCGFAHQSHFTSRFKQATGLTPTGWRKLADELRVPGR